jgi:hypothetical protein
MECKRWKQHFPRLRYNVSVFAREKCRVQFCVSLRFRGGHHNHSFCLRGEPSHVRCRHKYWRPVILQINPLNPLFLLAFFRPLSDCRTAFLELCLTHRKERFVRQISPNAEMLTEKIGFVFVVGSSTTKVVILYRIIYRIISAVVAERLNRPTSSRKLFLVFCKSYRYIISLSMNEITFSTCVRFIFQTLQ